MLNLCRCVAGFVLNFVESVMNAVEYMLKRCRILQRPSIGPLQNDMTIPPKSMTIPPKSMTIPSRTIRVEDLLNCDDSKLNGGD
jgi:hypothetical protein